jgi:hypothetical protein
MHDGAELGQAVAAHPGDLETALAEYEKAMSRAPPQPRQTPTSC